MDSSTSRAEQLALNFHGTPDPTSTSPNLDTHRIKLVEYWGIQKGDRVLEIGCGQGDTTVVLADAVGEEGCVVAVDPGALDYGAPHTLGEAQAQISASPLGSRITFHTPCSPLSHLASLPSSSSPTLTYTHAILSHSTYYFASPSVLPEIVRALTPHCAKICIAEWSLSSSSLSSAPHVLTVLLQALIESRRPEKSDGNIRTVLSPAQIKRSVLDLEGWRVEKERLLKANEGLLDGYWEASMLLKGRSEVLKVLGAAGVSEGERVAFEAGFDAVESSVGILEGGVKGVKCMDVWAGVFGRA